MKIKRAYLNTLNGNCQFLPMAGSSSSLIPVKGPLHIEFLGLTDKDQPVKFRPNRVTALKILPLLKQIEALVEGTEQRNVVLL